jgi:hypothetical protein
MAAAPLFQLQLRNDLQTEKRCAPKNQLSNFDLDDSSSRPTYSVCDISIRLRRAGKLKFSSEPDNPILEKT